MCITSNEFPGMAFRNDFRVQCTYPARDMGFGAKKSSL
ncbi:hypothetical protein A2U01_0104162, partial [Trifolium medium]|nr:hypothetical protein [Trifolium medium]